MQQTGGETLRGVMLVFAGAAYYSVLQSGGTQMQYEIVGTTMSLVPVTLARGVYPCLPMPRRK